MRSKTVAELFFEEFGTLLSGVYCVGFPARSPRFW